MKKLIAIPFSLLVAFSAFAQGQISYQNNSATLVMIPNGPGMSAATSADGIQIQMFYQVDNGGAAPAAINVSGALGNWIALGITGITAIPGGGIFSGGTQTVPSLNVGNTGPGQLVWLNLVAWNNNQPNLAAALGGGSTLFLASNVFAYTTGNPNEQPTPTPPGPITTPSPGAFTGLGIQIVPEPTSLAISAVGAAFFLFLRRRK